MDLEFILGLMEVTMRVRLSKDSKKEKESGRSLHCLILQLIPGKNRSKIKSLFCIMKAIMFRTRNADKGLLLGHLVILIKELTKMMKEMVMEK